MDKKTTIILLLLNALFLIGCNESISNNKSEDIKSTPEELAKGLELLENNCFSCHSPRGSVENRIAPPMIAIKRHYISKTTSKDEFTKDLIAFMNNPSEETSKMQRAVNRFGLMPKMGFNDELITNIAHYVYEADIEKPDWFEEHYKQEKQKLNSLNTELSPLEIGKKIAVNTKGVLGKNLLNAINTRGTEGALYFCSTKAIHLTDSMTTELNAHIKRVSDKNRNPINEAKNDELAYIIKSKELLASGKEIKPQLIETTNKNIAYYPIMTNKMCMQCHGEINTEVLPKTIAKIKDIYPNDKATDYKVDELRGIWVIEMDK